MPAGTVTIVAVKNGDGSMTITSSDTAGLGIAVTAPTSESGSRPWRQVLGDFIIGSLYP